MHAYSHKYASYTFLSFVLLSKDIMYDLLLLQTVMEVQNLRPSYWKFLLRLTKGRYEWNLLWNLSAVKQCFFFFCLVFLRIGQNTNCTLLKCFIFKLRILFRDKWRLHLPQCFVVVTSLLTLKFHYEHDTDFLIIRQGLKLEWTYSWWWLNCRDDIVTYCGEMSLVIN